MQDNKREPENETIKEEKIEDTKLTDIPVITTKPVKLTQPVKLAKKIEHNSELEINQVEKPKHHEIVDKKTLEPIGNINPKEEEHSKMFNNFSTNTPNNKDNLSKHTIISSNTEFIIHPNNNKTNPDFTKFNSIDSQVNNVAINSELKNNQPKTTNQPKVNKINNTTNNNNNTNTNLNSDLNNNKGLNNSNKDMKIPTMVPPEYMMGGMPMNPMNIGGMNMGQYPNQPLMYMVPNFNQMGVDNTQMGAQPYYQMVPYFMVPSNYV